GRLLPGVHELAHGRARVRTADDLELDVAAPAMLELRDPRSVDVRRGVVRVHHPDLRVTTPLTELRSLDGDAEFRVAEAGETEILIHDGELTFADRLSSGSAAQPITLQAGRLDHARLTAPLATTPTSTPSGPRGDAGRVAVAELTGPDAQFRGVINVDGRVLEFNSPAAFEAARRQTFSQFQRSPEEFIQRWKQMVQEMNSRFGSDGSFIELNGRRLEPRSGDAAFGFQFSSQSSSSSGTGANESFRGSININGRQHTFNSRAEFEAAQRELLKPTTKP
ncbi:MAG TPA: hypothetical protein PLV92_24895, partial [Pirellulaceae bacterium]|nr:hypothetical protein [Pirellulaceae bacterium]